MSSDSSSSTESSLNTSAMSSTTSTTAATDDSTASGVKSPTSSSPPDSPPNSEPSTTAATASTSAATAAAEPTPALKPPIPQPVRKVSGALLKASQSALSSEDASFPRLIHSLPLVLAEVNNGVDVVRRVGQFVERIAKAKQAYAAACLQALQEVDAPASPLLTGHTLVPPSGGRPRSASNSGLAAAVVGKPRSNSSAGIATDEQVGARFLATWKTLRDVVRAEALSDVAGAKAYHETVAEPLLNYHKELAAKASIVNAHADNMLAQLKHSQETLLQNKIAVLKLIEAQKAAEDRERQEREEKERGGSKLAAFTKEVKSIGFLFKDKNAQLKDALSSLKPDELRTQAYQQCGIYEASVDAANSRSAQFFDADAPAILTQLQQMEITRLETLRLHLDTLSQHLNGLMAPADKRVASYAAAVQAMSTQADVSDYVDRVAHGVGMAPSSRPNQYRYDLPFTADDIKHDRVPDPRILATPAAAAAAALPSSYFGTSLDACQRLSLQQGKATDVPYLLVELCDRIRRGGKPVFVSVVDLDDVMRVRSRLDGGEAFVGGGSADDEAELAAATLKMWLRDLDPHLISGVHYDAAVGLARAGEVKEAEAVALYQSLPPLQQRVLHLIASTLASVSVGGSMDSVATTLAPHLCQQPQSSDPSAAHSNINHEVRVISALLTAVANQPAPAAAASTTSSADSSASEASAASSGESTQTPAESSKAAGEGETVV